MDSQARDVDVIVIGGGAGMSAAITAATQAASVMLIEADARLVGSTALSGGVYTPLAPAFRKPPGCAVTPPTGCSNTT